MRRRQVKKPVLARASFGRRARRSGVARVARRETSTRPFVDGADDDGRRRERTRETRARIDREARARERRSGREDARARAPEIAHRTRIAMRANATHAARARAFSAYRFGTVEDVETLPMYRRKDDHDNGKYRASATTRALARARRAISRGERVGWLGLLALIFVGRTVFDGKENRVPSAMGVMPVMRRSVLERKTPAQVDGVDELVVVPGHAVYYGNNFLEAKDESNWALEPHQLLEGEAKAFMEHMERGVREVAKNPRAMLVFSGGKTRREAGAISEASSYWQVSRAFDWFGVDAGVELRSFTEEHARDSFENLLFSVCRFFELTRKFPSKITVVGFESKRDRFQKLHLRAIGYPESNFTYIGTKALNEKEMEAGEVKVREAFARDPFGCRGALAAKRHDRDPFNEGAPYSSQVKILSAFWLHIDTCSQRLYNGYFPWSPGMMIK